MFSSPFFWKLYATFTALVLVTTAGIGVVLDRRMESSLVNDVETSLQEKILLMEPYAERAFAGQIDAPTLAQEIPRLGGETGVRITLIAPLGRVIADSQGNPAQMENHWSRPEVQEALAKSFGKSQRTSATVGQAFLYEARAVRSGGRVTGVVRISILLQTVESRLAALRATLALGAGAGILAALGLGLLVARRITTPISAEQAQLRSMLAGMVEGVLAVDTQNSVLFCNRAACQILGMKDFAAGMRLQDLTDRRDLLELLEAARAGAGAVHREMMLERGSGDLILEAHASLFEGGGTRSVVVVLEDITNLKRLERIRRDFVANVSHEIKTPLTSIKGYVETLLTGALFDAQNNVRFLKKIEDHVGRLTNLVQDLLSLANIEAQEGSLPLAPVDWRAVFDSVLRRHEAAIQRNGLTCTSVVEPGTPNLTVLGDSEAMTQVLDNLLDNAIKYTPSPGEIRLGLSRENGLVCLEVEDTGIGIPEKDRERIFERFYRVDKARSREMGGTGLGLSIVKHLVQAMHGEVRVESEVGKGTRFSVFLPGL